MDKCVYCRVPNFKERKLILESIWPAENKTGLDDIATRTAGMTGADLRCLLATALKDRLPRSVYSRISNAPDETRQSEPITTSTELEVTLRHIENALESIEPSVSREEIMRFDDLAARFNARRVFSRENIQFRETLA